MNIWKRFKEWRDRPWTVEITPLPGVIMGGMVQQVLRCDSCAERKWKRGSQHCKKQEQCWKGPSRYHPPGTIRVDDERPA